MKHDPNLLKVALIGNPNSGKSTVFNQLTGMRQKTGNFPGVTVEVKEGKLSFTTDLKEMASKADFIHEAAPEREDLKIRLFKDIDAAARPDVIISSSSSGFLPTNLQSQCAHPERVIIGHPFNPVYLLPLVEIVPGEKTSSEVMDRAAA
ncbi:MAG TPA: 3-hydroxyacyl-CoA dehydrogenase NAD-binding domain-containing protein, partial [Saprospiraceae bacterium]|nr:3-hydroxyacyl-CoA dehydrogenase NAD-binding domain-containing protein [Saprospiraceae bacterium]